MNAIAKLTRHPAFLRAKLPVLMLVTLLQRSPVLRLLATANEFFGEAPAGFVLKSSVATVAALRAVHTLAGATSYVLQSSPTAQPVQATANQAVTPVGFTVTNTINIGSWKISGTIPAGMMIVAQEGGNTLTGSGGVLDATTPGQDDGYGGTTGGNSRTTPILMGTPTTAGTFTIQMTAYEFGGTGGLVSPTYPVTIQVAGPAVALTITTNPANQTVNAGGTATFTVAASDPAATFQWTKGGANIAGATSATLTLTNVTAASAGSYAAVATTSSGSVTSAAATLTVNAAPTTPVFTGQPLTVTVPAGATTALTAQATGATSYQWKRNGTNVAGATTSVLVLNNVGAATTGSYTVTATNAAGSATSNAATVATTTTSDPGRLINVSVITTAGSTKLLTVGFNTGGAGTSGQQSLLIRGIGPGLAPFNLPTPLQADPTLTIIPLGATAGVANNDNWGSTAANSSAVIAADTATFAFPITNTASLDAALVTALPSGGYSAQISSNNSTVANVLAEVYDNTPSGTYTITTPRLINLSCISPVAANSSLTAGFTIGGSTARTVMIRAVGPGLGSLGVPNTMANPTLVLNAGTTVVGSNSAWGGDAQITTVAANVNAFPLSSATSLDSVMVITLPPGGYSAVATNASGAAGTCIIEVYEVP